jgi:hypothetical protein
LAVNDIATRMASSASTPKTAPNCVPRGKVLQRWPSVGPATGVPEGMRTAAFGAVVATAFSMGWMLAAACRN